MENGDSDGEPMDPQLHGFSLAFYQARSGSGHFCLEMGGKKAQAKAPSNRRYQNKELMLINS